MLVYASFNRLNKIWRARNISRKTKATLFKTLVLSGLLYGCETRKMIKGEEKKLDILQIKCSEESSASDGSSMCQTRKCWRKREQIQEVRR